MKNKITINNPQILESKISKPKNSKWKAQIGDKIFCDNHGNVQVRKRGGKYFNKIGVVTGMVDKDDNTYLIKLL